MLSMKRTVKKRMAVLHKLLLMSKSYNKTSSLYKKLRTINKGDLVDVNPITRQLMNKVTTIRNLKTANHDLLERTIRKQLLLR